ncbi:hypothetical protein CL619_00270 [archaeon]|nr:hypothetical protein [archaeon]|tara:strand:- start:76 stop:822 length:747 start_codon:yes stop_codon:yes gene_type:complete
MTEWTWERILEHLKYEESELVEIIKNNKGKGKTGDMHIDNDDKRKFRNIKRDARRKIWRHLKSKRHILAEPLAGIEAETKQIMDEGKYERKWIEVLLGLIQHAMSIAKRFQKNKNIFFVHKAVFHQDSVGNSGKGFTTHKNEGIFATKAKALAVVKADVEQNLQKILIISCIDNQRDNTWFESLLVSCNIKALLQTTFASGYNKSLMNKAYESAFEMLRSKAPKDKDHKTKIHKISSRIILVEHILKE